MPDHHRQRPDEPFILWWMPVVAFLAPLVWAAWVLASADSDAASEAAFALIWPGAALYIGALVVLWCGWKIDLE